MSEEQSKNDSGEHPGNGDTAKRDPAEVFRAMNVAFAQLDPKVRQAIGRNIARLLKKYLEQVIKETDEKRAQPIGIAVNLILSMLAAGGRVVSLRNAEAAILFHQASEIMMATGEMPLQVQMIPPRLGYGKAAAIAAATALQGLAQKNGRLPIAQSS